MGRLGAIGLARAPLCGNRQDQPGADGHPDGWESDCPMRPIRLALQLLVLLLLPLSGTGPSDVQGEARDSPKHLYDRVMEEFLHRDYEAALAGFRFFLELYGRTSLAASAQYWVGECELRLGRYEEALRSFDLVLTHYPGSPKEAAAILKRGLIHARLGQHDAARILLERVLIQFPDRPEARLARQALHRP